MEFTKDIVLNLNYKKEMGPNRIKEWKDKTTKIIKNNKFTIITVSLLFTLISIDLALINTFLQLLNKIY